MIIIKYSVKQIAEAIQRTPQSIYRLFKSNKELAALLERHTIKDGRNVYYDDTVYEWFCHYYLLNEAEGQAEENKPLVENGVVGGFEETQTEENPLDTPRPSADFETIAAAKDETIEALRQQIQALEQQLAEERASKAREISDLEKQLQDKEAERLHFITENSKLSSIIQAEKQERQQLMLMLPPPKPQRQSIGQRIKALFRKNTENEGAAIDD